MKTKLLPLLILSTLSLSLFSSCQKGGSSNPAATTPDAKTAADDTVIPTTVCSDSLKKLITEFSDNQKQISSLFDQIKDKKTSSTLNDEYRLKGEKQVENCRLIEEKFDREKITGCLKSDTSKTKENSIYKSTFTANCKSIGLWAKKISQKDNHYTQTETLPQLSDFTFKQNAADLINSAGKSDFSFIVNGAVKTGKDNFRQAVQDGLVTCFMTTQITKSSDDLKYKYVTDTNDSTPPTDIGFEFNGNRSVIVLQDSNSAIHSMLCLNLKLSTEKDKKSVLQKVFGASIQISEKEPTKKVTTEIVNSDTAKAVLNQDVAPAPTTEGVAATPAVTAANPSGNNAKPTDQTALQKQMADSATMLSNQVKDVADHTIDKLNETGSKKLEEVRNTGNELIENFKAAGIVVMKESVKELKAATKEVLKEETDAIAKKIASPFIAAKDMAIDAKNTVVDATKRAANAAIDSTVEFGHDVANSVSGFFSNIFDSPIERAKKEREAKEAEAAKKNAGKKQTSIK